MGIQSQSPTKSPKAVSPNLKEFDWRHDSEYHMMRRRAILKKYPQMKELMKSDASAAWYVLLLVLGQTTLALLIGKYQPSWTVFLLIAYSIGGCFASSAQVGMHEVSHNLVFKKASHSRILGFFCNCVLGIPAYVSFKMYHFAHHTFHCVDGIDVDLPTPIEARVFDSLPGRIACLFLQPVSYALRPLLVDPKNPDVWQVVNTLVAIAFDAAIWYFSSIWGVVYLLVSSFCGMSMHPCAGHFISEHYRPLDAPESQETFSYYGPLNAIMWNVGYHVEHHDFPNICMRNLPKVRQIAPEFYKDLKSYDSWVGVMWWFAFENTAGAYRRIKRTMEDFRTHREMMRIKSDQEEKGDARLITAAADQSCYQLCGDKEE